MELLAPAGSLTTLYAALESGADAIYLGGKAFSARASAANFSLEDIAEGVRQAHLLGAAVYVAVNILVSDAEIPALRNYIRELDRIGVDAVIVQDLATAKVVQEEAKRLVIHGSTQMSVTNLATVNYLYKLGFKRVVLGRELSLDEIIDITTHTKAEIEIFVHGALCVCYSGQCLMSSYLGGRSGNRGACAQPCRLPYELLNSKGVVEGPSYVMSPKDLNYIEYITSLIAAGVHSFKVEGRMKQESYVRDVISSYRHVIDRSGHVTRAEVKQLEQAFNRGFTTHYLMNQVGKAMITHRSPAGKAVKEEGSSCRSSRKVGIYAYLTLSLGEGPTLTYCTEQGVSGTASSKYLVAQPKNTATTKEYIQGQLGRLGNTIFELLELHVSEGDYYIPASVLNQLRRDAIHELEEALLAYYEKEVRVQPLPNHEKRTPVVSNEQGPIVSVRCDELEHVKAALSGGAKKIIFGGDRWIRRPYDLSIYQQVVALVKKAGAISTLATPRIVREWEVADYLPTLKAMVEANPTSISVSFLGAIHWLRSVGYAGQIEGDSSLNIFNATALKVVEDIGFSSTMISEEVTMEQLRYMAKHAKIPLEAMVHGEVELMVTEHCAIAAFAGKGSKKACPGVCLQDQYFLKDRKGNRCKLRTDPYCRMHILNSRCLDMRPYVQELLQKGLLIFRIEARQGDPKEVYKTVKEYVALLEGRIEAPPKENQAVTRGHYFKGIV